MELTILGDILLGVWIGSLPRPFDYVSHILQDHYTLDWFYIEIVLKNSSSISWV